MISPYTIDISDERLATIRAKVEAYDWSQLPDARGWTAGVGVDDLKRLITYWLDVYDWRKVEHRLNQFPNFTADVEGERLHFVHVQGDGSKPPILLLHGWPGSYLEFERLVGPLAADGHDVIVPSLPGFAFSRPITGIIGPRRAAELMHGLMVQLFGESRYIVQGGDWGAHIASWMAYTRPDALLGFHINMVFVHAEDATPTTPEENTSCVAAALWPERIGGLVSYAGYDIIDIASQRHPAAPSLERMFWYQHLFQSERGRECLTQYRRVLCRMLWTEWSPSWKFDEATFAQSAIAFENPDFVEVVIHCYRNVFGLEAGDPALQPFEDRLALKPTVKVPTVTIDGATDPLKPGGTAEHASLFVGLHQHRVVAAGHNVPQQAPQPFADAVLKVRDWFLLKFHTDDELAQR